MPLKILMIAAAFGLLVLWIISAWRPRLRRQLLGRYRLHLFFDMLLLSIVVLPGWTFVLIPAFNDIIVVMLIGILLTGALAISKAADES